MTRKEILNTPEIVDFMLDKSVIADSRMKLHKRLEELCKLAIKALDQELCEDVVSRKEVKEQMLKYGFHAPDMTVTEFVEYLPPVNPQEPCEDCISRKEVNVLVDELARAISDERWQADEKIELLRKTHFVEDEYGYTDKELVDKVNELIEQVNKLSTKEGKRNDI